MMHIDLKKSINKNIYSPLIIDRIKGKILKSYCISLWGGVLLYSLTNVLVAIKIGTPKTIFIAQLASFFLIFFPILHLTIRSKENLPKYLLFSFVSISIWYVYTIFNGLSINIVTIKAMVLNNYSFWVYLVPLFLIFGFNYLFFIRHIFAISFISNIIYICLAIIFFSRLIDLSNFGPIERLNKYLAYSNLLLILTFKYQTKKIRISSIVVYMISLLFVIYQARRNQIFTISLTGIFAIILHTLNSKNSVKKILIYFPLGLIAFLITQNTFSKSSILFNNLFERLVEDSRSGVEEAFWADMNTGDVIIGRGMSGEYYCPNIEYSEDEEPNDYRSGVETGYLDIILKSGLIGLSLQLLLFIPSIYLGLNRSNNLLSKSLSIFILIYLLELFPAGNPMFTLRYLFLWIALGFLYNKRFRQIPDLILKKHLH